MRVSNLPLLLLLGLVGMSGCAKDELSVDLLFPGSLDGVWQGACVSEAGGLSSRAFLSFSGNTVTHTESLWTIANCANDPGGTTVIITVATMSPTPFLTSDLSPWTWTQTSARTCTGNASGVATSNCSDIPANVGKKALGVYKVENDTTLYYRNSTFQADPAEAARPTEASTTPFTKN